MGRGSRHRSWGARPPWWPEGEAWPPPPDHWRGARRRFLRRIAFLLGGLYLLVSAIGGFIAWVVPGRDDYRSGPHGPPGAFFGVVIVVVLVVVIGRAVRRTAAPIGDVMEAANRVASGDYAVRVDTRSSGEVGQLVTSFNEMAARLQANEAQRRTLLADVAHELRTPLAVIRGNIEGMLDGVYPRDDEHLGPVLDETTVMARLLDDLRTLSLAEAGALRLHREPTDVGTLVDDVVSAFAPRAAARGVTLTGSVADLPELDIDPVRVREVLENLVANAVRYTPGGGAVGIAAGRNGRGATFSVADTGPGIPPETLPHVFDRFWKTADSGGSGLGLAIAKSLVEAHGGEIRAESLPGSGTTMRFTLPVG